ncbi:hypothetical protein [Brachybacterium vulturis]|nr:hypothetical protein [Brachybacterium vulturis]
MVSRRGLLGGAAAVATAVLSGCGVGRKRLVAATEEAAAGVEGVSDVALERSDGANFERLLHGTVSLETADRTTGLAVFDEAMRAIVTVVHAELDDQEARSLRVGGVAGVLDGGEVLTPMDLDPDMSIPNPRLDRVTAGSFYEKYGLS